MLALVERDNQLSLLLTKRANHLKHHPGQISFPGGKVEVSDIDLVDTAIRETQEEIGIRLLRENILGRLLPMPTVSGYFISPILGFADHQYQAKLDHNEVDLLFELPIEKLLSPSSFKSQLVQIKKHSYPIYTMHYQDHLIWGATAHILYALHKQITNIE